MALTPAERQRRHREKQQREIDALPKIECGCGCGTLIAPITKRRKPARFAHGHNPDGEATRIQPGDREMSRRAHEARRALGTDRGPGHANWRGGEWRVGGGYVRVTLSAEEAVQYPTALRHGRGWSIQRSHAIWNRAHPTDLVQRGDEVHHRNRIRDDDRLENLGKMTRAAHRALHAA